MYYLPEFILSLSVGIIFGLMGGLLAFIGFFLLTFSVCKLKDIWT